MKKRLYLLVAVTQVAMIVSCNKKELPFIPPSDVTVNISYATTYDYLPLEEVKVSIRNTETGQQYEKTAGAETAILFEDIPAGFYDATAQISFSPEKFLALSGYVEKDTVVFSATATRQVINANSSNVLTLALNTGKTGDLLIKQIYYAGSNTTTAASFRDQFIEIFNNSTEVIYADSLYITQLEGYRSASPNSTGAFRPDGQYDWQRAYGMPANINANTDYVYCKTIFRIPGTGKQHPIQPGTSIIIAQNALNHKSPYTGVDGTAITPQRPDLTIDLSGADFEAYYGTGRLNSDIDVPAIPNMIVIQDYGFQDMILDNPGRDAFAIFHYNGRIEDLPGYAVPRMDGAAPSASAKLVYQLPVTNLIDAVEVQHAVASSRFPKKLWAGIDAGFAFVPDGQYSSQSLIRKTSRQVNGRRFLKDTNNSTEDFDYFELAQPRGFKD
ncbi:MAG: DUF4876 domain-containing protein [Chitinophagaceae bacterium]